MSGYIKLWRSWLEHPIFRTAPTAWGRVALCILLKANWKPAQWCDGRRNVKIPAGSFVTSEAHLSELARATRQQIRRALAYFQDVQFITIKRTKRYSLITVTNWATYQDAPVVENQVKNQTENQLRTTIEEGKSSSKKGKKKEPVSVNETVSVPEQPEQTKTGELNDYDDDKNLPEKWATPEEELIALIHRSTKIAPDATLLKDITDTLMLKGVLIQQYIDDIRPRLKRLRRRPRPGFFLQQAQTFGQSAAEHQERRAREVAIVAAQLAAANGTGLPGIPAPAKCGCKYGVIEVDGQEQYCANCELGRDLKRLEDRKEQKRAASAMQAPVVTETVQ